MVADLAHVDTSPPWMQHLERAHKLAHAAARWIEEEAEPSPYLAPAARKLEGGIGAMYDAFDGRADRVTALNLAHARLWDAAILLAQAGLVSALTSLREACTELIAAEERSPRSPAVKAVGGALRAGADEPPLHRIERASLLPSFRTPPAPEPAPEMPEDELHEPTTFEELAAAAEAVRRRARERVKALTQGQRAPLKPKEPAPDAEEVPPGFALAPPKRLPEDDFVRRWARECFEEIGMLGIQRQPLLGDDWRACKALERRLVAAVDALAALGASAIAYVEPLAMDAPAADPMRMFAVAMIGGCLEGRDALACAERVLHRFGPGDPVVAEAFASAMKLAPNPLVPGVMRSLLESPERGCRAIAVEVLAYRGWLTPEDLAALADEEDPRVFALALPALAVARHADLDRALSRALAHPDLRVQEAALDAMALAAHSQAASAARAAAQGALGERALVRLALVANEDDARWLLLQMRAMETPEAIHAIGWAGLVEAVPALIRVLESDSEDVALAAGAALERMLGANLLESIEVQAEALEEIDVVDPDPEPRPPQRSLDALVSHPRDPAPSGSPETLEVPTKDPTQWGAYWAEHGHRLDPKQRLRRGHPYSPSVSLFELDQLPLSPEDRRRLHQEIAAQTGKLTLFDPHDFVVVQERSLAAWGALVRGTVETPGAWGRAPRGR
jgi:hypothetical protein